MSIREIKTEILVIGGGAAGMAVSRTAADKGAAVLLCDERKYLGGILPQCLHEGFGLGIYSRSLTGPQYCEAEKQLLLSSSVQIMLGTHVISINSDRSAIISNTEGISRIAFDKAVLATGCIEKNLYTLPVTGTRPAGVHTAGEAQEMLNIGGYEIGDNILILGSGDIGQIMARQFKLLNKNVIAIIEQRNELGGLKRNQQNCIQAFNIPVILNASVSELKGYPELEAVKIHHFDTQEDELIYCNTLITSIGLEPDLRLIEGLIKNGPAPDWIYTIGNASHVHEIVDSVTSDALALGKLL